MSESFIPEPIMVSLESFHAKRAAIIYNPVARGLHGTGICFNVPPRFLRARV